LVLSAARTFKAVSAATQKELKERGAPAPPPPELQAAAATQKELKALRTSYSPRSTFSRTSSNSERIESTLMLLEHHFDLEMQLRKN
jgi:hypothetical protein